jgi:1-deoxy-D-xylulose-5-phosphate synthase
VLETAPAPVRTLRLGLPDRFVDHGEQGQLLKEVGLDVEGILKAIRARYPANS